MEKLQLMKQQAVATAAARGFTVAFYSNAQMAGAVSSQAADASVGLLTFSKIPYLSTN